MAKQPNGAKAQKGFIQSHKITLSLFPADDARLLAVQIALAKLGKRVSASQIVRLALRALPMNSKGELPDETAEQLVSILEDMQEEDGRTLRHRQ